MAFEERVHRQSRMIADTNNTVCDNSPGGKKNDIEKSKNNENEEVLDENDREYNFEHEETRLQYYKEYYPFVYKLLQTEQQRTAAFHNDGKIQMNYPKSNEGWIKTVFIWKGRALDQILFPWSVVTINAIVWTAVYEYIVAASSSSAHSNNKYLLSLQHSTDNAFWSEIFNLLLNTTLGFLLVFRLNRSATRFWLARQSWGIILVKCRAMVSTILLYGKHQPVARDACLQWIAVFAITTMHYIRGYTTVQHLATEPAMLECYVGLLTQEELQRMFHPITVTNPTQYAADQIRCYLAILFAANDDNTTGNNSSNNSNRNRDRDDTSTMASTNTTNLATALLRTQQLIALEQQLNVMIDEEGAMERIKGTPLPLVYVTHLRTWLLLYLLSLPYFWIATLRYGTIPVVILTSFALLGIEGAASDVEAPFTKGRTNHLDMDTFCLIVVANILQQTQHDADFHKNNNYNNTNINTNNNRNSN